MYKIFSLPAAEQPNLSTGQAIKKSGEFVKNETFYVTIIIGGSTQDGSLTETIGETFVTFTMFHRGLDCKCITECYSVTFETSVSDVLHVRDRRLRREQF